MIYSLKHHDGAGLIGDATLALFSELVDIACNPVELEALMEDALASLPEGEDEFDLRFVAQEPVVEARDMLYLLWAYLPHGPVVVLTFIPTELIE